MLVRFPDEASARNAAVEMDAVDFAVSRENIAVPVTKYPNAHGHWRPSHPTVASTMAHGDFVIHVIAKNPTPNLATLTGMVEKTFDEEPYDRYVANVASADEADVRQRAAAQYALLVNPL
jgi:hypothetical protein